MAYLFPKRKISETENKLRVLHCLDALGMATMDQLWPFVAELELMEYIPFCMLLDELKKDGSVVSGSHALEGVLFLSPEGLHMLELFSGNMSHTDCERIHKAAPAYAAKLSNHRQGRAVYEKPENGKNRVTCTVLENDVPTMVMKLFTDDEALAESVHTHFPERAPRLLTYLYTLPMEEDETDFPVLTKQEEAMEKAARCGACLIDYGGRETGAAVWLGKGQTEYGVSLLLPDAKTAKAWAAAALKQQTSLNEKITALFEGRSGGNFG